MLAGSDVEALALGVLDDVADVVAALDQQVVDGDVELVARHAEARPTARPAGRSRRASTRRPNSASAAPRLIVVVVLPTPPFWLHMAMMRAGPCEAQRLAARGNVAAGAPGRARPAPAERIRHAASAIRLSLPGASRACLRPASALIGPDPSARAGVGCRRTPPGAAAP